MAADTLGAQLRGTRPQPSLAPLLQPATPQQAFHPSYPYDRFQTHSTARRHRNTLDYSEPHEQVHTFQQRAGAKLVRWFQEGHAEWVGRKVSAAIAPDEADANAREYADALNASKTPVRLANWGGLAVKREAILRQVSTEDRRKLETDPTYVPAGPFSFKPDDFESDESNTNARYQASWALFRDLEQTQGGGAVRDWATSATSHAGAVSSSEVVASAPSPSRDEIENRLQWLQYLERLS